MTQLTAHFSLDELVQSQEAARRGIDNTPPPDVFRNLVRLCDQVLEQIRKAIDGPLVVNSGYRSTALNAAVGGSKNSDHMRGLAADIIAPKLPLDELMLKVRTLAPYITLKQCIREFPPNGWVHVSCTPADDDYATDFAPQFLVATLVDGQVKYTAWNS